MSDRADQQGLTLVETLVALAILAAVSLAAFVMLSQASRFAASEQERLVASIFADNLAVNELARSAAPSKGTTEGKGEMAGRQFTWRRVAVEAGLGLVGVRYEVSVAGETRVLARVEVLKAAK